MICREQSSEGTRTINDLRRVSLRERKDKSLELGSGDIHKERKSDVEGEEEIAVNLELKQQRWEWEEQHYSG